MAFQTPPIATPEEAAELGVTVSELALKKASIRVRSYLTGRASLVATTNATAGDSLKEVVITIAQRLQTDNPALATGIQSEGSDGQSVTYGWDAWQGISTLVKGETEALDRLFPSLGFSISVGA